MMVRPGVKFWPVLRRDQEMLDEQGMPGIFADHAGLQLMGGIGTGDQILNEQVAVSGVDQKILLQGLEMRSASWPGCCPTRWCFRLRHRAR